MADYYATKEWTAADAADLNTAYAFDILELFAKVFCVSAVLLRLQVPKVVVIKE